MQPFLRCLLDTERNDKIFVRISTQMFKSYTVKMRLQEEPGDTE